MYSVVREVYIVESQGLLYKLASTDPIDLDQKQAKTKEKLIKEALAKLNPAEREALGLK